MDNRALLGDTHGTACPGGWLFREHRRERLTSPSPKGRHEANIPAKHPPTGEASRIPSSHVDTCRTGHLEGTSASRSGPFVGLTNRPAPVRGRQEFLALQRSPRRAGDGVVRVHFYASDDDQDTVRVAYSISRKVGGAVVRNRWRRRLRAIAAEASSVLAPGAYLVGVSPDVRGLRFSELRERVVETMRRASGVRR